MSDPAILRVRREGHLLFIGPVHPYNTIRSQVDLYHQTLEEYTHPITEDMVIVRESFAPKSGKTPWTRQGGALSGSMLSTPLRIPTYR